MSAQAAQELIQGLDSVRFAEEALRFNPDPWQAGVLRSSRKRLLLNCSRQTGKSTITSIKALHRALYFPGSLILLISPSLRQSSELFRKVTDFIDGMESPPRRVEDNRLSCTFTNGSRIVSLPSKEGTIRGYSGAALIIEDEASRVPDELYRSIRPMLAVSGGQLVLMSTPAGKRGHFFEVWENGGSVWERTMIPATQCPRITPAFLEEERRALGDRWFRQEYLCSFEETNDQVFSYDFVMGALDDTVQPLFPSDSRATSHIITGDIAPLIRSGSA